jgi:endonuclease YncB( thermonuclease family)
MTRLRFLFLAGIAFVFLFAWLPASAAPPAQSIAFPAQGTAATNANLRSGPGTNFARVGGVTAGDELTITSCNDGCTWYKLDSGNWIASSLVELSGAVRAPAVNAGPPAGAVAAQVTGITDGDTITVRIDGKDYKLRYILMNTPEVDQPLGDEATDANRALVMGKTVYLVKDVSETDRYGRLLRYVYLADGTFVNAELVRQGWAQVATFPPDVTKEAEIRAAQQEAVAAGRGLWATQPAAVATALPSRGAEIAVATPTAAPAAPVPASSPSVQLVIVVNRSTEEVLEIRNSGSAALDISGWRLDGSKGDDFCTMPAGTTLAPGAGYQVATGDSQPQGAGMKCGDKPIWNNGEETIYLRGPGGVILSIESVKR